MLVKTIYAMKNKYTLFLIVIVFFIFFLSCQYEKTTHDEITEDTNYNEEIAKEMNYNASVFFSQLN